MRKRPLFGSRRFGGLAAPGFSHSSPSANLAAWNHTARTWNTDADIWNVPASKWNSTLTKWNDATRLWNP